MRVPRQLTIGAAVVLTGLLGVTSPASAGPAQVLRVGTWNGIPGNVATLDAAVAQLQPGGWLLIGPGDYHPRMDYSADQASSKAPAAVLVTASGAHLRGMNRNSVVIDGTRPGSAPCSSAAADQDFGPLDSAGNHRGRSGLEATVSGVYFENLTACNFLAGSTDSGNEIWWNGGDDSGKIGLGSWWGNYLSATSTYYGGDDTAAAYGIFVSNADGPGSMDHTYASNFSDSGYYIGACPDCNAVINHAHSQYNALGYSGTNSGGHLIVENSEWDHNKTGFVSNSQNSADPPSPQDGACPGGGTGPTGTHSCWVFTHNYVHDNNDPNVPAIGDAAVGPVGAGVVLAGDRNNTITGNRFVNNGSWAVLVAPFPDPDPANPNNVPDCRGGVLGGSLLGHTVPCLYDDWGNRVTDNAFQHNGFYGNVTNGDIADLSVPPLEKPGAPGNCYSGNHKLLGGPASTWPVLLQLTQGICGNPLGYPDPASDAVLLAQAGCATQLLFSCPGTVVAHYPRRTTVVMHALPAQPSMPNPCAGVPQNPWCPLNPAVPVASSGSAERPNARPQPAVRLAAPA
jgi:hypothetical protein